MNTYMPQKTVFAIWENTLATLKEVRCHSLERINITDCKSFYENYQLTPQSEMVGCRWEFPVL